MKWTRLLIPGVVLSVIPIAATLWPVRGDSAGPGSSQGERVIIDGKSFLPGGADHDDFSAVRGEFRKYGIAVPDGSGNPARPRISNPAFSARLVASGEPDPGNPQPLPPGLVAEHALRFETDGKAVDLVLGRMRTRGASIGDRLAAAGWEGPAREDPIGMPRLLENKSGKEKTLVFLDETEGTFLLFRDGGR